MKKDRSIFLSNGPVPNPILVNIRPLIFFYFLVFFSGLGALLAICKFITSPENIRLFIALLLVFIIAISVTGTILFGYGIWCYENTMVKSIILHKKSFTMITHNNKSRNIPLSELNTITFIQTGRNWSGYTKWTLIINNTNGTIKFIEIDEVNANKIIDHYKSKFKSIKSVDRNTHKFVVRTRFHKPITN